MKKQILLCLVLSGMWVPALAIQLANEAAQNGKVSVPSRKLNPPELHAEEDAHSLRTGVIMTGYNKKNAITVNGVVHTFDPNKILIYRGTHNESLSALVKGQKINFILDPKDKSHHTLQVIYLLR